MANPNLQSRRRFRGHPPADESLERCTSASSMADGAVTRWKVHEFDQERLRDGPATQKEDQ